MRRKDRERTEIDEILRVVEAAQVCRLAFASPEGPYLVPVSFGFDGEDFFFHTAPEGRKIRCIEADPRVCFELEHGVELLSHPERACAWTFAYASVIGFGRVEEVVDPAAKAAGLDCIMAQYGDGEWSYPEATLVATRVWRIVVESMSCKVSRPKEG